MRDQPPAMTMGPIRAAQYVRMSTEHQKYSIENQSAAIRDYATRRGFSIVRTYADDGISGLNFERRDALKRLIKDVQSGAADFDTVLVLDISRWGRFQDPDESAYYEWTCKLAGIAVHYCAEPFENDGSLVSSIIKSLQRAKAAEFSRELGSIRPRPGRILPQLDASSQRARPSQAAGSGRRCILRLARHLASFSGRGEPSEPPASEADAPGDESWGT